MAHQKTTDGGSGDVDGGERGDLSRRVDRSFTCTVCGFAMRREAGRLQRKARAVCLNCGDWTVQFTDGRTLVEEARTVAAELDGAILTERQALAFLLRAVLELDRRAAAEAMESTPSNVDNLHRRASEKIADARRITDGLDGLRVGTDGRSER